MKKKLLCCLLVISMIGIPLIGSGQEKSGIDSGWTMFSNDFRLILHHIASEKVIDTNNVVDIFMFKFRISNEGQVSSFQATIKTPSTLLIAMKESVDSLVKQAAAKDYFSSIAGKTFVLPLMIDYWKSPVKRSVNNLTTQRLAELMIFDDNGNKATPVDCILLPIFFYQSPHSRSLPKSWLKGKQ